MAIVLKRFGAPVTLELLTLEVARVRQQTTEKVAEAVRRIAASDKMFVLTAIDLVVLTEWSFEGVDQPLPRLLKINGISQEQFDEAQSKLTGIDWRADDAVEKALAASAPISLKLLGAVAYANLNSSDSKSVLLFDQHDFYTQALAAPGYVFGPGAVIHPEADVRRWIGTAVRVAERLAPEFDVEEAAPIDVKADDIDRMIARIISNEGTTTTTRLLEEFYEITPGNKTFPDDLVNISAGLQTSDKAQWVGGDRFRKVGDVPEFITEVPEPFQFTQTTNVDEEGELVDVELTDEGLSSTLRKLLQHPLAMDVVDEDIQPAPKQMPESIRLVLKSIHRELGTFPLAQIPTGFLDGEPKLQEIILIDPTMRELQVWVNQEARLMYNLFDWWYEQPVESGAVFTLTRTHRPNVFEFAWMDQPDPVVFISNQRMEELRNIGAEAEGKSTLDLLIQVMAHWPKGADYLTLLAEANVVRRISRRLLASLLSSYQCFYQRSGSPVWHFDSKKVEQGFDKTKKKFIKK